MTPFLLLLLSVPSPQAPQVQAQKPPVLDIVELKNGDRFEGRITNQLDGYVELEIGAGAVVGVSIAQVKAIRRGTGAGAAIAPVVVPARNEWFVLHDAHGAGVGWLHATVSVASDGTTTISEEYEFANGARRYQVTSMCKADASLQPVSCYFRERISDPVLSVALLQGGPGAGQQDRIVDERIVQATCQGDHLQVVRIDRAGRRERTVDCAPATTFPLLAQALARSAGGSCPSASMFDPATEELVAHSYDPARQRRVTIGGKTQQVTEIAETSLRGRNSEWLDAGLRTLRREIAGPALVAVPCSADSARRIVPGAPIASALIRDAGGQFGLWAPNPAWQAPADQPPGQITLLCEAHGASIGFSRIDHFEAGTSLPTAVDAVANWFRLLHPDLRIGNREKVVVRGRDAVRLLATGGSAAAPTRATVDVIPHRDQFLVLVCRAPAMAWEELAPDFAFLLRSVELEPQAVAPVLQGPLAERERQPRKARPVAAPPEPRPPVRQTPKVLPPNVRIVDDDAPVRRDTASAPRD